MDALGKIPSFADGSANDQGAGTELDLNAARNGHRMQRFSMLVVTAR